jgi:hypothetical protein
MKYVEKTYGLRVKRKDGSSKLLLGIQGVPVMSRTKHIPVAKDRILVIKITALPRAGQPGEAKEI